LAAVQALPVALPPLLVTQLLLLLLPVAVEECL
jgi:hypothetical protein